jgi:hypothetical protein
VVEVLADELQAGLAHIVFGEVDSSDALECEERFYFLRAFLADAVVAQAHHLKTPHIHDSTQELP